MIKFGGNWDLSKSVRERVLLSLKKTAFSWQKLLIPAKLFHTAYEQLNAYP
jgi:hypothetical protein